MFYRKKQKDKGRLSYFAEESVNDKRSRRKGTHQRISKEQGNWELCIIPCKALADLYDPIDHMDRSVIDIRNGVKREVKTLLGKIRSEGYTRIVKRSVESITALLKRLDDPEMEINGIPNDVEDLLTDMAIGAPANCAYRIFKDEEDAFELVKSIC